MPALAAFRKLLPADDAELPELIRVFCDFVKAVDDAFLPLNVNPRARSVVQKSISVGATATVINHKVALGAAKTPNGWHVTDIDTNATIKRTAWDQTTITLTASAACVVQLEVW